MNSSQEISTPASPRTEADFIVSVGAIVCGLGLVILACLATSGLDISAGFF
jgi:hypothetical protein